MVKCSRAARRDHWVVGPFLPGRYRGSGTSVARDEAFLAIWIVPEGGYPVTIRSSGGIPYPQAVGLLLRLGADPTLRANGRRNAIAFDGIGMTTFPPNVLGQH